MEGEAAVEVAVAVAVAVIVATPRKIPGTAENRGWNNRCVTVLGIKLCHIKRETWFRQALSCLAQFRERRGKSEYADKTHQAQIENCKVVVFEDWYRNGKRKKKKKMFGEIDSEIGLEFTQTWRGCHFLFILFSAFPLFALAADQNGDSASTTIPHQCHQTPDPTADGRYY